MTPQVQIHCGDCLEVLRTLPSESVHCCVTSPPYYGLRDYGHDGQIGIEKTPQEYVEKLVAVFQEVKRVLRDHGTFWLNLVDSYASFRDGTATPDTIRGSDVGTLVSKGRARNRMATTFIDSPIKHKDILGVPWRVAFALQSDGWYLRQDIIWHKPNPMPESVTDRCTKAHEYIFLLSKRDRYWFDGDAIKETSVDPESYSGRRQRNPSKFCGQKFSETRIGLSKLNGQVYETRNRRSVWTVASQPYSGAHFATFPPDLIKPCVLAGCPIGGTVLDPFGGSGTTGQAALELGRNAVLIELNPKYVEMIEQRTNVTPAML